MRSLLAAELRKLTRPLVWGSSLSVVVFCLLITWAGAANAHGAQISPRIPGECVPAVAPACAGVVAQADAAALAAARDTGRLAQPGQGGQIASGMLASLPGLLLVAMVAGGHWGGEWGLRTVRALLTGEGRRTRVLAAKWITVWGVGVATLAACWAALAVLGPLIVSAAGLPAPGTALWAGFGSCLAGAGRAVVTLGMFAAVAVAAGALSRGQLATTALTAGPMVLALVIAGVGGMGRWSPASFVQDWMDFGTGGYLPTNFWSRFVGSGPHPGEVAGLAGMTVTAAVAAGIARWRLATDITV